MVSNDFTLSQDNKDRDEIPLSYRPIYTFSSEYNIPVSLWPSGIWNTLLTATISNPLTWHITDNFQYHCSIHTRYQMDESFIQFLTFKQEIFQISSNPVV